MSEEDERPIIFKECGLCHKEKSLENFYKKEHGIYGVDCYCKLCRSKKNKRWYRLNSARAIANNQQWQKANPKAVYEKTKRYRKNHPGVNAKQCKKYYHETVKPRRKEEANGEIRNSNRTEETCNGNGN